MMARLYCAGLLAGLLASGSALAAVDLNGVWQVAQSVQELKTVEGKAPPLKPEAATSTDLRADNTLLDSAGLPHSESLKVTEKVRLLDNGATLENRNHDRRSRDIHSAVGNGGALQEAAERHGDQGRHMPGSPRRR